MEDKENCLTDEQILDFIEGRLIEEEEIKILNHIDHCEKCFDKLSKTRNYIEFWNSLPSAKLTSNELFNTLKDAVNSEGYSKKIKKKIKEIFSKLHDLLWLNLRLTINGLESRVDKESIDRNKEAHKNINFEKLSYSGITKGIEKVSDKSNVITDAVKIEIKGSGSFDINLYLDSVELEGKGLSDGDLVFLQSEKTKDLFIGEFKNGKLGFEKLPEGKYFLIVPMKTD